jgi:alkaline phosphatase
MLRRLSFTFLALSLSALAQVSLHLAMPERTRLLEDQHIDIVLEVRNAPSLSGLRVMAGNQDITSRFTGPVQVDLDCDARPDSVYRANLVGFPAGAITLRATANAAGVAVADERQVAVYSFRPPSSGRKSVILFIGDGMSQPYRDAARMVAGGMEIAPGASGFRQGFYDKLLEMDNMPIFGSVITHSNDRVTPDSANTASAWASGNKAHTNGMNVFTDGTDCSWRLGGANLMTLPTILDNPRVETLWEYLRRKYNYRTGIVSTADIADATPAGQAAHTAFRQTRFEVIRQYFENPMLNNQPAFDLILGGGWDQFMPEVRTDGRDMIAEAQAKGFRFVTTASELRQVGPNDRQVLGIFYRNANPARASDGIRSASDPNMSVAYDKLRLTRPGSEVATSLGQWTNQPFLDLMTQKAVEILAGPSGNQPFILMVEAASIDKQSHVNHMSGTLWDTLELDKAIGWARRWSNSRPTPDTLVVVTADHAQSMVTIGTAVVSDDELTDRTVAYTTNNNSAVGAQTARVYRDILTNIRSIYPFNDIDPNQTGPGGPPSHRPAPLVPALGFGPLLQNEFPEYQDTNGDGYPENTTVNGRGTVRLSVGFRTGSHTADNVPVSAEGPGEALFSGVMDQTDLMFRMASALEGGTEEIDQLSRLIRERVPPVIGMQK